MEHQRVLIDTCVLIDYLRKQQKEKTVFYSLASKYVCLISSITQFELLIGTTDKNKKFIDKLMSQLIVLPLDSICVKLNWKPALPIC